MSAHRRTLNYYFLFRTDSAFIGIPILFMKNLFLHKKVPHAPPKNSLQENVRPSADIELSFFISRRQRVDRHAHFGEACLIFGHYIAFVMFAFVQVTCVPEQLKR